MSIYFNKTKNSKESHSHSLQSAPSGDFENSESLTFIFSNTIRANTQILARSFPNRLYQRMDCSSPVSGPSENTVINPHNIKSSFSPELNNSISYPPILCSKSSATKKSPVLIDSILNKNDLSETTNSPTDQQSNIQPFYIGEYFEDPNSEKESSITPSCFLTRHLESQGLKLGKKIGEGCSGKVYLLSCANKTNLFIHKQSQAVKIFRSSDLKASRACASNYDPGEGDHLILPITHPNILAPSTCFFLIDDQISSEPKPCVPYLGQSMSYFKNSTSLAAEIAKGLTESRIRNYMYQISDGLSHLHAQKICHGDIHPENILITENQKAMLIDFGLAHKHTTDEASVFLKTRILYSAPEKSSLMGHTTKADAWSFGVMLYQMLHKGCMPFNNQDEILKADPIISPEIPADLKKMLSKLLEKNPSDRLTIKKMHRLLKTSIQLSLFAKKQICEKNSKQILDSLF